MLLAAGSSSYSTRDTAACHPIFRETYPAILHGGHRVRSKHDLPQWRAGDVLVLPEQASCPTELLERGVRVYIWLLGAVGPGVISKKKALGCKFIAHTHWLATAYASRDGLRLPPTSVVRPYFSPKLISLARVAAADAAFDRVNGNPLNRRNVVLLNHDLSRRAKAALKGICEGEHASKTPPGGLECIEVVGYKRDALPALYRSAKVIVGWCMRGAEKTVIEAALFGVHLVTSTDCMNDSDARDFPVPASHRAADERALPAVVARAVEHYAADHAAFEPLRQLYFGIGAESMAGEVQRWLCAEGLNVDTCLRNEGLNCWTPCGTQGGSCPTFCGSQGVCCRREDDAHTNAIPGEAEDCAGIGGDGSHFCMHRGAAA